MLLLRKLYAWLSGASSKAKAWCGNHWKELLAGASTLLAFIFLARRNHTPAPVDPGKAAVLNSEVDALREHKERLEATDAKYAAHVSDLEASIALRERKVAELHTGKPWTEMSDDEVQNALKELGL